MIRDDDGYEARSAEYRDDIARQLTEGRASFRATLEPGARPTFQWNGAALWVDRARWVAVPAREMERVAAADVATLPTDTPAARRLLATYAGDERDDRTPDLLAMLAEIAVQPRFFHSTTSIQHFVNDLVIQPLVNPAFESLYWIVLAHDVQALAHNNIYRLLAPLMFDMTRWPASRADAATVRRTQIAVVAATAPTLDVADAATVSDESWAAICAEALRMNEATLEGMWLEVDRLAASVPAS